MNNYITHVLYNEKFISNDYQPSYTSLSSREREILNLFYIGHSYKSAARILGISNKTVECHSLRLYEKLKCHSKAEAVYRGLKLNLIDEKKDDIT